MTEMEKIRDLVLRYAQAIHTQDERSFRSLYSGAIFFQWRT